MSTPKSYIGKVNKINRKISELDKLTRKPLTLSQSRNRMNEYRNLLRASMELHGRLIGLYNSNDNVTNGME
jgi:hypothetical protein